MWEKCVTTFQNQLLIWFLLVFLLDYNFSDNIIRSTIRSESIVTSAMIDKEADEPQFPICSATSICQLYIKSPYLARWLAASAPVPLLAPDIKITFPQPNSFLSLVVLVQYSHLNSSVLLWRRTADDHFNLCQNDRQVENFCMHSAIVVSLSVIKS